jgi:hypothetical protein
VVEHVLVQLALGSAVDAEKAQAHSLEGFAAAVFTAPDHLRGGTELGRFAGQREAQRDFPIERCRLERFHEQAPARKVSRRAPGRCLLGRDFYGQGTLDAGESAHLAPAQEAVHCPDEAQAVEWLHEQVVRAGPHGKRAVRAVVRSDHDDDGDVPKLGIGLDGATHLVAPHARHLEVRQDQVGTHPAC